MILRFIVRMTVAVVLIAVLVSVGGRMVRGAIQNAAISVEGPHGHGVCPIRPVVHLTNSTAIVIESHLDQFLNGVLCATPVAQASK